MPLVKLGISVQFQGFFVLFSGTSVCIPLTNETQQGSRETLATKLRAS